MVDFVEAITRPILTGNDPFTRLAEEIVKEFPMFKDNKPVLMDKVHYELALATIQSLWCGWISQAKANRSAYTIDTPDKFREAIDDAFTVGRDYSYARA